MYTLVSFDNVHMYLFTITINNISVNPIIFLCTLKFTLPYLNTRCQVNTDLITLNLDFQNSYKCNYTLYTLSYLGSLTHHATVKIQPCRFIYQSFIVLLLGSIPLDGCTFCLCVHLYLYVEIIIKKYYEYLRTKMLVQFEILRTDLVFDCQP